MITVVCLSPSLDQTLSLPALRVGETNRVAQTRTVVGGKGVNVAMCLHAMGAQTALITCRHAQGGERLSEAMEAAGIRCTAVPVTGELRTNLKVMDLSTQTITEINASAAPLEPRHVEALEDAIRAAVRAGDWLVLTGSMPPGCPGDFYARMIRIAHAQGCRVALDAEGEPFRLGVAEKPDFIKPNRHELELFAGHSLRTEQDVLQAAQAIVDGGVETVIVSMDTAGSVLVTQAQRLCADAVKVPVVTTVGAGDALVSGFLKGADAGLPAAQAFGLGVASATRRVAGDVQAVEDYLARVHIRAI